MVLNKDNIKNISNDDIYNYLFNIIYKIYTNYNYLNISKEDYLNIVYEEIIKSKDNYRGKSPYKEYIRTRIEARIKDIESKLINNEDTSFMIIDNYINFKFDNVNTYEEAFNYLKKLNNLFMKYSFIPEPNIIINLINKNNKFSNILKIVTNRYIDYIEDGRIDKVFNDSNIIVIIGTYCMTQGIEIKENDDNGYEINDTYISTDIVKMYLNEISKYPLLSIEKTKELIYRINTGDKSARELFINSNLRLPVSIAKKYYRNGLGVPFLDLIQAGNLGLMKALDKYDITLGYRFSTYATWWIKQSILKYIADCSRVIRLPINVHEKINAYKRAKERLEQKSSSEVTLNEIATEMGISLESAMMIEKAMQETLSLDAFVKTDSDTEVIELVTVDNDSENDMMFGCLSTDMKRLFEECKLTPREIEVLSLRYGLVDGSPKTLQSIASMQGVTRELIRRIEASSLAKIRNAKAIEEFTLYMDNPDESLDKIMRFREKYLEDRNSIYKSDPLEENIGCYNALGISRVKKRK